MPTVTLLEKVYGSFFVGIFEPIFSSLCQGLKIQIRIVGKTDHNWVKVKISGEDETVALRYLDQKFGIAPASVDDVKKFSTVKGRIVAFEENEENEENGLHVDIGISSPQFHGAFIPLQSLRAQITDGKPLLYRQIIDSFCLYENLPLEIKIVSGIENEEEWVKAEFSERQLSQFARWLHAYVDRLIVFGAPLSHVEHAVRESNHFRDIIKIDSLGLLEHAVVCKLGTDAVGLIPKLGKLLSTAKLAPFSSRRIQQLISSERSNYYLS
jgi:hypothetical protein